VGRLHGEDDEVWGIDALKNQLFRFDNTNAWVDGNFGGRSLRWMGPMRWGNDGSSPGVLKSVSVGVGGVWLINTAGQIFRMMEGSGTHIFALQKGELTSIAAADSIWGINQAHHTFRWNGADWDSIPGEPMETISVTTGVCWGINAKHQVLPN